MVKIGILSDTHGFIEPRLFDFFSSCDMLFHAGDIGNMETADALAAFKPLIAVHGNIDGQDVRAVYPEMQKMRCEEVKILMVHIGGYPGRYDRKIYPVLKAHPPQLFITGHSHILKVMYDRSLHFLHINPGAIGNSGIHQVKTAIRLTIDKDNMKDMEILELPRKKVIVE
ncbi:MAG: metallophosphatase family protein [Bacteroidales bacterium]|jgi:putative phosphoesterase|nr:metallophosphatase family protein [Bacteroidales bacterium]